MSRRTAVAPAILGLAALLTWTLGLVAMAAEAEKPALSKSKGPPPRPPPPRRPFRSKGRQPWGRSPRPLPSTS